MVWRLIDCLLTRAPLRAGLQAYNLRKRTQLNGSIVVLMWWCSLYAACLASHSTHTDRSGFAPSGITCTHYKALRKRGESEEIGFGTRKTLRVLSTGAHFHSPIPNCLKVRGERMHVHGDNMFMFISASVAFWLDLAICSKEAMRFTPPTKPPGMNTWMDGWLNKKAPHWMADHERVRVY